MGSEEIDLKGSLSKIMEDIGVFSKLGHGAQSILMKLLTKEMGQGSPRQGLADRVMVGLLGSVELMFVDQVGVPFVKWKQGSHAGGGREFHKPVMGIGSKDFRSVVMTSGWAAGRLLKGGDANAVVELFSSMAITSGEHYELHLRVAYEEDKGRLWYDLSNWRAVEIWEGGWRVVNYPPPLFRSYPFQRSQVDPEKVGDYRVLEELMNIFPIKKEWDRLLFLVYFICGYLPHIPRPLLLLNGPKGSGKTMAFRLLRQLIDPAEPECIDPSHKKEEWVQAASHHYCVFVDNMSNLSDTMSDFFCRLCTGEGFSKRALYSDDSDIVYSLRRLVGYNGINLPTFKSDLFDRVLVFDLSPIDDFNRQTEMDLLAQFNTIRSKVLGAAFTVLGEAMGRMRKGFKLVKKPRMADFASWGEAIAQALGYSEETFLNAYFFKIRGIHEQVLQENPLAQALLHLLPTQEDYRISCTPIELLQELNRVSKSLKIDTTQPLWPKEPGWLIRRLKELEVDFRAIGISITQKRTQYQRQIEIVQVK